MLKKIFLMITAVTGVYFTCNAAEKEIKVKDVSVGIEFVNVPEFESRVHKVFSAKSSSSSKWLMIRVEYTPERQRISEYDLSNSKKSYSNNSLRKKNLFYAWADDVQLDVKVLMETGYQLKNREKVLFSGKTVFWSVRCDGEKHVALMFVPAKMIDRYFAPIKFPKLGERNFEVVAELSAAGKSLAKGFYGVSGNSPAVQMRNFDRNAAKSIKVSGGVVSRARSPWMVFAPDNFDLEKNITLE